MKKQLFLLCWLLTSLFTCAQAQSYVVLNNQYRVYCEVVFTTASYGNNKYNMDIDFGQEVGFFSNQTLVDEKGKKLRFNSIADGLNYLSKRGWYFIHNYPAKDNEQPTTHWIFYKDVSNDQQITEGFLTKELYKERQEQK